MSVQRCATTAVLMLLIGAAMLAAAAAATASQTWGKGRIAFISTRAGSGDVFVMHDDGTRQRNLTHGKIAGPDDPAVSPNGKRIAFTGLDNDGDGEIFLIDADGGKARNLTKNLTSDFAPAWSPDGRKLAYDCSDQTTANLCVLNVSSGKVKHLTHGTHHVYTPTWSPDGKRIAFSEYDVPANQSEIWTIHSDGSHLRRLTNTPSAREYWAAWSPNGKQLAVENGSVIQFVSAKTGEQVGATFAGHNPSWSPDGKRIDYYLFDGSDGEIFSAKPDGSGAMNLTDNDFLDFITAY